MDQDDDIMAFLNDQRTNINDSKYAVHATDQGDENDNTGYDNGGYNYDSGEDYPYSDDENGSGAEDYTSEEHQGQHYSLDLHDRSRHDKDFHRLLQDDTLSQEMTSQASIINFTKPLDQRLYSKHQYHTMNNSGQIPYTKRCDELHIVPSRKILRELSTDTLSLAHYGINESTAMALAAGLIINHTVTSLNLEDNWIGEKGAAKLAFALTAHNKSITKLDVSRNQLGLLGAFSIASIFKKNDTLTDLNMSRTNLNNKMTEALTNAISSNKTLTKLDLSANSIGPRGADAIARCLEANSHLKELNLAWNSLGEAGAKSIAKGMQENTVVSTLNLAWNGMGWKGGQAWGVCLLNNDSITDLNLSNNRIEQTQAWDTLVNACQQNEVLAKLTLSGNYMSPEEAEALNAVKVDRKESLEIVYDGLGQLLIVAENLRQDAAEEAEKQELLRQAKKTQQKLSKKAAVKGKGKTGGKGRR
jgi:Ran GTPase-activating protein (RanGAP) involved in mRNA processing and transport